MSLEPRFTRDRAIGDNATIMRRLILGGVIASTLLMAPSGGLLTAREHFGPPLQASNWTPIFNGRDLTGWTPKFSKHELGLNLHDTFRVENGLLKVAYDKWTSFNGEFGHLFHERAYSHYRIAVEYRFVGEQLSAAGRGLGWAIRNNGLMLHSQDPKSLVRDQDFPISIEVQLLGGLGAGPRPTANLCTPGTHVVLGGQLLTAHCTNSTSRTYDGDQWVRVEVLVLGDDLIRHVVDGVTVLEYTKPQIGGGNASPTDPAVKVDGTPLTSGYIAIQAETSPTEFRKIEIMNMEHCKGRVAACIGSGGQD